MGEILANSATLFKEGFDGCGDFGGLGVKAEILVDARGEAEDRLQQGTSRRKRLASVGCQVWLRGDTEGVEDELIRVCSLRAMVGGYGVSHYYPGGRLGEDRVSEGMDFQLAGRLHGHPGVRLRQGERGDGVAEIVNVSRGVEGRDRPDR